MTNSAHWRVIHLRVARARTARPAGAAQRAPASDGEGFGALPHLKHALGAHVAAVKIGYEHRESVDAFP